MREGGRVDFFFKGWQRRVTIPDISLPHNCLTPSLQPAQSWQATGLRNPQRWRRRLRLHGPGLGKPLVPYGPKLILTPSCHQAGLTSGNEPWQYTISRDVLPQPPSPTITIFNSFLAELGAAAGAGAPGASIARSPQRWMLRAGSSPVERQGGGGATGQGYEAPPTGSWRHLCQAASQVHLPVLIPLCYGPGPGYFVLQSQGK